ncbi:DUF4595 domain-containing protein [Hoylesella shahii]|uniref:Uncharacterized protein with porin-like fold DUF4595 n=1 Tax=Hoylesella shahii DSM 15611 = JCM 12083 TaxID=1122991 RepID=A0A318HNW3_9BACT|nr:DUF4595 domain-containing protein [Hoylesella shahii]PXX14331.1 uncharacterized protein with porin-like fold DUF4595 [Hoylesella shahii DSM 15611 = JCM 12083]
MKKIIIMTYLSVAVLGATMTFSSCSNDNDDATSTVANPQTVFTGGLPKSIAGMTIQTNEKGQVIAIVPESGKLITFKPITFKYKDATTRSTASTPDVVMTIGEGKEYSTYNLYLNKDGFVKHCEEVVHNLDGEHTVPWNFTYNSNGQLLTMQSSGEGATGTTTIIYQNGNIVETKIEYFHEAEFNHSHKIYYTSTDITTPIENKGSVMLFDENFGLDSDDVLYAYYAGLLGKATKDLPVKLIDNKHHSQYTQYFSWTLNSAGYPISFKGNHKTYSFSW